MLGIKPGSSACKASALPLVLLPHPLRRDFNLLALGYCCFYRSGKCPRAFLASAFRNLLAEALADVYVSVAAATLIVALTVSLQASLLHSDLLGWGCGSHLTLSVALFSDRQNVSMPTHISFPACCGPIHEAFVT